MNQIKNPPPCPEGGLVPENFPVRAVVISDKGMKNRQDSEFTADVVKKVLTASGKTPPLILLPVSEETAQRIQSQIDQMSINEDLKKKYRKSIIKVPATPYTWQQDYFQSFIDQKTGQIVLREVQNYDRHGNSFNKIIEATKDCGFQQGPILTTQPKIKNGYSGGNIEVLPSGICLLGDDHLSQDQWENYANQICLAGEENRIKVPTSWLSVGHTDEIMKVVRNKKSPAPCDFSVTFASPHKALELLKKEPNEKFLNFSHGLGGSPSELTEQRTKQHRSLKYLCSLFTENKNKKDQKTPSTTSTKGISKLFFMESLLPQKAHAGLIGITPNCAQMTNSELHELIMKEEDFKIFNQLVQEKMDLLKNEVSMKLKKKLPQCQPHFIDVPNLFSGMPVTNTGDKPQLPQYALPGEMGVSLLPNPTNSISINDTIISPDPSNKTFQKYLEEEYKKIGLKADFVDTFDYAFIGEGNLHCVTNTIHICRPKSNK